MAGRALTPAGVVLKWILIPVALAAVGFFLIGAKIGAILPGIGGNAAPATTYSAPEVDVVSSPKAQVTSHQASKARRHKSRA